MRKCVVILALLFALPLAADNAQRIREAVALHDAGKYDEAIAIYKAVLADDHSNDSAAYELALTYDAKQDFANCRALLEPRLAKPGPFQAAMYAVLANCLEGAGQADRAIATYRKGLAIAPNDSQLLYNLAVSLASRSGYDEARALLERELRVRPDHGSGHLLLAQIFAEQRFRAPAVAEYLRFLAVEPASERSKPAGEALLGLLNLGVERKGEKNVKVTLDPDSPKEEGDYSGVETGMALVSGARFTDEKKLTEFDRTRDQIVTVVSILVETAEGSNYTAQVNVPFFAELRKKELLDAFAAIVLLPLNLPGQGEWLKKNARAIQAYQAFQVEKR